MHLRCASCSHVVSIDTTMPWRCPYESGDRHHVLVIEGGESEKLESSPHATPFLDDQNPFLRYLDRLAFRGYARSVGLDDEVLVALVRELDARVERVAGTGFRVTPLEVSSGLGESLDFPGRVWVKDETHNVAGSHKARHLFSILVHLVIAERTKRAPWTNESTGPSGKTPSRPPLAISSCGNAAIAAATLAAAAEWPIDVFIPEWAGGVVVETLDRLGARAHRCPRRADDPPGDPTVLRFREAVASGSIPFSVQGPENALCLDGGRTIGWEIAEQLRARGVASLQAVYAQVGGGAFAASLSRGLGEGGVAAPLVAVQTEGCAPLSRAWSRYRGSAKEARDLAADWTHYMWPWEHEPVSLADGILDDETYDWVVDLREIERTGGRVVVAPEPVVRRAAEIVPRATGIDASPTGTAGAAGLLDDVASGNISGDGDVLVVLSGVRRS
jgi:threonine dehydratase